MEAFTRCHLEGVCRFIEAVIDTEPKNRERVPAESMEK